MLLISEEHERILMALAAGCAASYPVHAVPESLRVLAGWYYCVLRMALHRAMGDDDETLKAVEATCRNLDVSSMAMSRAGSLSTEQRKAVADDFVALCFLSPTWQGSVAQRMVARYLEGRA